MSEHTKAPWTVVQAIGSRSGTYRGNYEIAEACDGEHESNARLISAAPELLAALVRLTDDAECFCEDYMATEKPCPICEAHTAIDKAEGTNG